MAGSIDKVARRRELYGLLGDLPQRERKVSSRTVEVRRGDYVIEKLVLDLNGIEDVPAWFVKPLESNTRLPTILYHHAHGGDYQLGKDELLKGRDLLQQPPYALELTRRGYAALCIDHWAFGERNKGRTESAIFKRMLWEGRVMWGMMVYDCLKAADYLLTRDDVDPDRLAVTGLSMGSTLAWWQAALDPRIKVCVDLCCLTDYQALIDTHHLDGHGVYYYVPGLLKQFTAAQINALIAPRPHLSLAGNLDPLTPPQGLDRIDAELKRVYAAEDAPEAWRLFRQDVDHRETPQMRAEVVAFLEKWL